MKDGVRTPGVLLSEGAMVRGSSATSPTVHVLEIKTFREVRNDTDLLPSVPALRRFFTPLPQAKKHISTKTHYIPLENVVCLTRHVAKGILPGIFGYIISADLGLPVTSGTKWT
jgi:antiviral helicase SKI2